MPSAWPIEKSKNYFHFSIFSISFFFLCREHARPILLSSETFLVGVETIRVDLFLTVYIGEILFLNDAQRIF